MVTNFKFSLRVVYFCAYFLYCSLIYADNFNFNSFNNHGVIGIINTPTARFYDEGNFGITFYNGDPDQKITLTSSPYDWLEASFFYTNIQNKPYCENQFDSVCRQDYKDKGFNFKFRIKEEGVFPAIAIGINDIAGTGLYGSEYIVGSYGVGNLDMHFGIGWGQLNGQKDIKNPLSYIHDSFKNRPAEIACLQCSDKGGQFNASRYFSDESVSPFFGMSYALNKKILFKLERDTTLTPGEVGYNLSTKSISYGVDYNYSNSLTFGLSHERGEMLSIKFIYKHNAKTNEPYKYNKRNKESQDSKYSHLIKSIESNGIGVNKITESAESIGIEITQFSHPTLDIIEEIIFNSAIDSGIDKDIKTSLKIADLEAYSNFDEDPLLNLKGDVIYERKKTRNFNTNSRLNLRPYIAGREGFLKFALLAENDTEYIIKDNFFFSSNLKYGIWSNFDDLTIPPATTYPAQVRSDVKDYLRNFDNLIIGRAQFDYHLTPFKNNHLMFTAGILEEMFSGYGFEYLYFSKKNYAIGFEVFDVTKRDYDMQFKNLDYQTVTSSINFYYRNYEVIPFDAKVSFGEYLAGDEGATFELSRTYSNGTKFGVFATFTDVSAEQFGEGSFDKGIFFNIPIVGNTINYTWRPLTKDPGAKLNRKHTLYDLLVKFRPIN